MWWFRNPLSCHQHGPQTCEEWLGAAGQAAKALRRWAQPESGRNPGAGLPPCLATPCAAEPRLEHHWKVFAAAAPAAPATDTTLPGTTNHGQETAGSLAPRYYQVVLCTTPCCSSVSTGQRVLGKRPRRGFVHVHVWLLGRLQAAQLAQQGYTDLFSQQPVPRHVRTKLDTRQCAYAL